ncbi:MAG: caspase family protein [Cytophagales bacterium]|nr:caspase family protein [Cytophagales bacterium]
MKTLRYLVWALCISIPSTFCAGQSSYAEYSKAELISSDQFDEAGGWKLTEYQMTGGWLARTHVLKGMALKQVQLDENRDFEMEISAEMAYEKGVFPKIYLGDYSVVFTCLNQFGLTCNTGVMFLNKPDSYGKYLASSHTVAPPIPFSFIGTKPSLITIRKIDGRMYFFINRELVASAMYKPFSQQTIGVHTVRAVDFITVNYLKKGSGELAYEKANEPQAIPFSPARPVMVKPGGKHYALLIGVSTYADSRLSLNQPTEDAQKLKELLVTRYSFSDSTTFLVLNPTRQKLIAELFRLRKVIGPNDNLLVFYAGHGYWDEAAQQGYWWPSDAIPDDPSNWLSNSDVREQIRSIKSGHTLLVSDACFSGGIFKTRSANSIKAAGLDIQYLYRTPSRRAITSGTMTTVPDKSVFFQYLFKRLQENQEPFLASQQLFDSFRLAVINNSQAIPQDGVIAETGDEGGDFVFIKRNP